MPLLKLETTAVLPEEKQQALLAALSQTVASCLGKPEQYVMVTFARAAMVMSGRAGDAAWVELRSIGGLSPRANSTLAQQLCQLLHKQLGVASERIYLNFMDVAPGHWGWNGVTFA